MEVNFALPSLENTDTQAQAHNWIIWFTGKGIKLSFPYVEFEVLVKQSGTNGHWATDTKKFRISLNPEGLQ